MKVIAFVIALALFLGGMVLMGYALEVEAGQAFLFVGGILAVALSLTIPFHLLKALDR